MYVNNYASDLSDMDWLLLALNSQKSIDLYMLYVYVNFAIFTNNSGYEISKFIIVIYELIKKLYVLNGSGNQEHECQFVGAQKQK